ncbi:MAG: glycosyl transferase [Pseudomonas sp.]|nr:glycosyl transferase [Pseudomonas sp.]|tara:strand:+ start:13156 stop:14205 length:1050 start_codon:yes stop_codon:yes gene_type:complete
MIWLLFVAAAVTSFVFTGLLRRYALSRSLLDTPNARSSHTVPTPRGGGVAIVIVYLASALVLQHQGAVGSSAALAIVGAGAFISGLGFADDHRHIPARWRLLGHFGAASWALYSLGGLPPVPMFGALIDLGWGGHALAIVLLVWLLNLYNFMDGIDGIAAVQAICACLGAVLCYAVAGTGGLFLELGVLELLLACATFGFLCWNFPTARIFMGDAGSGFLGLSIGMLMLQAAGLAPRLLWAWLILLGVFVVDATYTLLRRLLRGEAVYQAHRSHAYQIAARRAARHTPVTVSVGLVVLGWLLPWALLVSTEVIDGMLAILFAYAPLLAVCIWLRAGTAEVNSQGIENER